MKEALHIKDYAKAIHLHDEYIPVKPRNNSKDELVNALLSELVNTNALSDNYSEKRKVLHAKLNTLQPNALSKYAVEILNQLLQCELSEKQIINTESIIALNEFGGTKLSVWQGDITTLAADAIVNAANSQMLGCFSPLHACIDNAIHTAAGVQLRDDCNTIMQLQGFDEPTGMAKITRAYNLPSKYVLHTVGPIANGNASERNKLALASAYKSCLYAALEMDIQSIAFCGISTGVFGFPSHIAAQVAVSTVSAWLNKHPNTLETVVFNVFSDADKKLYEPLVSNTK